MVQHMFKEDKAAFFKHFAGFIGRRFSPQYWVRYYRERKRNQESADLWSFYDQHAEEPDLSKKFIYVALHYQPECTTCPMAGVFVDQLLMIQLLAACIPDDVHLYVKDHPKQKAHCRDIQYYKDILAVKNTKLVSRNVSTFDLRENCLSVATATGTVGFEAIFREKPALMFGHHFYEHAPGVHQVQTYEQCKKAVDAIMDGSANPSLKDVRIFMRATQETSAQGAMTDAHQGISQISAEENIENIGVFIEKAVQDRLPAIESVWQ